MKRAFSTLGLATLVVWASCAQAEAKRPNATDESPVGGQHAGRALAETPDAGTTNGKSRARKVLGFAKAFAGAAAPTVLGSLRGGSVKASDVLQIIGQAGVQALAVENAAQPIASN